MEEKMVHLLLVKTRYGNSLQDYFFFLVQKVVVFHAFFYRRSSLHKLKSSTYTLSTLFGSVWSLSKRRFIGLFNLGFIIFPKIAYKSGTTKTVKEIAYIKNFRFLTLKNYIKPKRLCIIENLVSDCFNISFALVV